MSDEQSEQVTRVCVVLPSYNNDVTLASVLGDVLASGLPVIVVNDGSTDGTAGILREFPQIEVVTHAIQTMPGIPRKLDGDSIQIEVNGELRKLALNTIQAVAAVGIVRSGQKPVVLVDLLLDSPWDNRKNLRAVRLMSNSFDPRPLVGVEEALPAFQKFLIHVLEVSEAVPLPDPDSARGQPFRSFPSITAYQQEVLNAES